MLDTLLFPFEWFVATIMVGFHSLLTTLGLPAASGWAWALSIVGLVLVLRVLLIPLFVKQIKSSRRMQMIQPEQQKIQKKYKGKTDQASRQAMTQETMELYKRTGTNPFASCLPILIQAPFFLGLFRVLNYADQTAAGTRDARGPFGAELAQQMNASSLFGAELSDSFLHGGDGAAQVLTMVLIILMSLTTFTTQRQLMRKNMPAAALDNPMAKQQKILLYALPVIFLVTGVNFPVGVLLYWLTTNVWSMCQQFFVIRRMPAPGSPAERALEQRRMAKGKSAKQMTVQGTATEDESAVATAPETPVRTSGQRAQPKSKKRKKGPKGQTGHGGSPRPGGRH